MRPVAILSDFGYSDPYVGIMKAVVWGRCPGVSFLDLTHGVAPQDVCAGALALEAALPYLPTEAVVLAVVDPGVGSARRAIVIDGPAGTAVGPDNGLLTPFLVPGFVAYALEADEHRLPETSATFHGRDVFAPAAAHVASGGAPSLLGARVLGPARPPHPHARPPLQSVPTHHRHPRRLITHHLLSLPFFKP